MGVGILRVFFENERGEEVLVHVPTTHFFCPAHTQPTGHGSMGSHEPPGLLRINSMGARLHESISSLKHNN